MKKLFFLFLAAGLLLAFNANSAAAQTASTSTFSGMAVRWNGEAIAGATIAALRGPLESDPEVAHTVTAADGSYTLTVPAGETYWLHIRTFGTYWGYSYYIPFTPRAGETISKVYFALGPRDVKDVITLPTPESNVAPEVGTNEPPATPPQTTTPPVSNVKPIVGSNDEAPVQPQKPATQPHKPATLPTTGAADGATLGLWTLLALAGLGLVGSGLSLHALRMRKG
jgi:hypothetical protein